MDQTANIDETGASLAHPRFIRLLSATLVALSSDYRAILNATGTSTTCLRRRDRPATLRPEPTMN
jgi:hypothetical protein